MDNDLKIIKKIKSNIKSIKFKLDYRDIDLMSEEQGNDYIRILLNQTKAFMVARCGATEMRCVSEYLNKGEQTIFSHKIRKEISELSGVFPNDDLTLREFCKLYIELASEADLLSLWGVGAESKVVHKFCEKSKFTELHALEPYYFNNPWSQALEGKKVLVIHPFTVSISSQYHQRDKIFLDKKVLPSFNELICIKAVQSIAGQRTEFSSWFEALDYMKTQIDKVDFEVAIIGAGAYGLPLAAYVKSIGKKAIQMSGATQILFGIKGKRWDSHPVISKFYNDYWVRPTNEETPPKIEKVEGGSYW